ncbi:MAG: iron-sulfur cluster assembly scaffold protein [Nanoarchaeota archaeon]|nr:iron-sulfur cluster assembly scaffold protein [Nanoarchaeota archaeon]
MYSKKAMNYFKNPKFTGEIKNADAIATVGNIRCGDVLKFFLKIKKNKIIDVRYQTYGCVAAISSSEALARMIKGKTIKEAEKITNTDVVKNLGYLPAIKLHCSVLGVAVLKKAIENYKKTQKD